MGVDHSVYRGVGYATKESVVRKRALKHEYDDGEYDFAADRIRGIEGVTFFVAGTYYAERDNDYAVVLTRTYGNQYELEGLVSIDPVEVTDSERKALQKAFKKITGFKPTGEPTVLVGGLWH